MLARSFPRASLEAGSLLPGYLLENDVGRESVRERLCAVGLSVPSSDESQTTSTACKRCCHV
jgi:hypothetical protein